MIDAGEIPREINQQLEFFSKNAQIASEKVEEELKLNPQSIMKEGEEEIIDVKNLEQHLIDREHFKFDSKIQTLLNKLEAENFKKSVRSSLTTEEKHLLEVESKEEEALLNMLTELKAEGIPEDLIPKATQSSQNLSQLPEHEESIRNSQRSEQKTSSIADIIQSIKGSK